MNSTAKNRIGRRRRMAASSGLLLLLVAVLLPFIGILMVPEASNAAAPASDADLWRQIRAGESGVTQIQGAEAGVLIQAAGEDWRGLRNDGIREYGGWLMALSLVILGAFLLFRGRIRLMQPRSGRKVERWSGAERVLHWYTAVVFTLLAVTGLSLLLGRTLLIPLTGKEAFAAWAGVAKVLHDYAGPLFLAGVVLMALAWMRDNVFTRRDWHWFRQGGGLIGKGHPSAGRFNGGEKVWFWLVVLGGLTVSATGLILDFPNFDQSRATMQLSNLIHATVSVVLIATAFGHIYIGTVGTEGALEGMVTGAVDETWARQHHDVWYDDVVNGKPDSGRPAPAARPGRVPLS